MEVRTKFKPFKSGDKVSVKRNFPYVNQVLLDGEVYTVDKMLDAAGVITLKGLPYNKTFPVGAFELIYNGEMSGKE